MRLTVGLIALVSACSSGGGGDDTFVDSGGSLTLSECNYAVTTKMGAEAPKRAKDKLGTDPTPRLVHLGIVGDPKTSMVVQWRTNDETTTTTTVRYAQGTNLTEDQLTQTATGVEFGYRATGTDIYRMHQGHLCGLTPGTAYSYQVGAKGHFSPVYTFHTAPDVTAQPDAEVILGFVGDSRGGYDTWGTLVGQLAQRTPDIMLFSGDATTVGLAQPDWEIWLGKAESLFTSVPIVMTNGNHENNAINFYSQFAMPGDQENYGFDYGYAHITVANDTPEDPNALTTTTLDAIKADLEASKGARWKMLMHHQPMYDSGTQHGSNLTLRASWGPVVDQYQLDLVLNGHEHEYEITKPMRNAQAQATNADGTVYVIAGGAGAELYNTGSDFWTAYSEKTFSAATLRVRRDQLTLDPFRPDGSPIAAGFTKTKP